MYLSFFRLYSYLIYCARSLYHTLAGTSLSLSLCVCVCVCVHMSLRLTCSRLLFRLVCDVRDVQLVCMACTKFLGHLVNQQVLHELVALQLVFLLLEKPTDDSVEVACDFIKECGLILSELTPQGIHGIFERFRAILHEGETDKRVQYMIEGLIAVRKSNWKVGLSSDLLCSPLLCSGMWTWLWLCAV